MRWTLFLSRRLAALTAGLLIACLAVGLLAGPPTARGPKATDVIPPAPVAPLFASTEPAANASVMMLQADDNGVTGWIAGAVNHTGDEILVKAGKKSFKVPVRVDNTFRWDHRALKKETATFSLFRKNEKPLTARTKLLPAVEHGGESIFFVTDRSAYRPGHTLKFAAFLRKLLPSGDFEPIRDRAITVDVAGETGKSRAARLRLRSDALGRVTGEYTFSEADPLDHYTLTADKFLGSANVLLAEYRKSKVMLKLRGDVKGNTLTLTFDARDYLDRPVKGLEASYTAVVTRSCEPEKLTLDPTKFAHPAPTPPPSADDIEALPDDERLLTLANGISAMTFTGLHDRPVAERKGKVDFTAEGSGTAVVKLNPDWLRGRHTITVAGLLLDETGRENRASSTLSLEPQSPRSLKVTTPREMIASGEKLPVVIEPIGLKETDKAATTLIVVRLDANAIYPAPEPEIEEEFFPENVRLPALSGEKPTENWTTFPLFDPIRRTIATAFPVIDNKAELSLSRPGAYKLLAVTRLADGTTLRAETGVVVKAPAMLPGIVLKLAGREIASGTRLRGSVHTRFAGAKLWLTLRDSQGLKYTKVLNTGPNGVAMLDEPLPANLRYGCAVSVAYPESATAVHADQRELFVLPNDRTITVTAKVPEIAGPGQNVTIDLGVNRQEEVDLVVSVFDESLLGVSGDLSGNIRDFYLADTHGLTPAARAFAATRFGDIAVKDLIAKARMLLKKPESLKREARLEQRLSKLVEEWDRDGKVNVNLLPTLVRLAGFEVYSTVAFGSVSLDFDPTLSPSFEKTARLAELFHSKNWNLATFDLTVDAVLAGNTVMIALLDRKQGEWSGAGLWSPYRRGGANFQGFGGISGFGGFQGFGLQGSRELTGLGFAGGFGGNIAGAGGGAFPAGNFAGYGAIQAANFNGQLGGGFGAGGGIQGGFSHGFSRDLYQSRMTGLVERPLADPADDVIRRDFSDSAFWSTVVRTDAKGQAKVTFKVPDSLVGWRVAVTAVSSKMHVGTGSATFRTSRPIMIWPMLPRTFAEGDRVELFGLVNNLSEKPQTMRVRLKVENGRVLDDAEKTVVVPPKGNVPVYWTYEAGKKGMTDLLMSATCDAGSDASLKRLPIVRTAVEERATASGLVRQGKLTVTLPADFVPGTAKVQVTAAPSLIADMADTLPYLVEYPYGCVEQTMSRFLPAVRVSQILQQSGLSTNSELEKKLPKVVETGIKRLLELQQSDGGWGWQGSSATHELMTPYALYGLIEAEKAGHAIPNEHAIPNGIDRLRAFLKRMETAWKEPGGAANGEINDSLYCLAVFSQKEAIPDDWWFRIQGAVGSEKMSDYGHALALEMAVRGKKHALAGALALELRKRAQKVEGRVYWRTAGFSRWRDNVTEVTAVVFKALVAYDSGDSLLPGVLTQFQMTKRGNRWDSTKDTAGVLLALCDYLHAVRAGPTPHGTLAFALNGGVATSLSLEGAASRTATLPATDLKAGANEIAVRHEKETDGVLLRAVVTFSRNTNDVAARDYGVKVDRTVLIRGKNGDWTPLKSGDTVPKGSFIKVQAAAQATDGGVLHYTLLESPKPACGETIPVDDNRFATGLAKSDYVLREDRDAMTCFHYENTDRAFTAEFVFLTEYTGEFRLPPARVERMYHPTSGGHSDSFVLKVRP